MILAIIGSALILLCGMLLVAVGTFILPNVNFSNVHTPPQISPANLPSLVSGIVRAIGGFGLVCGAIVLASAVLLPAVPHQRRTWGVLILVFSVLSFLGLGGFIVGAILGIVGGILALRWKPPVQSGQQ
jgi:MFS family permease